MFRPAISSALIGIRHNLIQFESAAAKITEPNSSAGFREVVDLKQAELGIKVNTAVIKMANETSGLLLDIFA